MDQAIGVCWNSMSDVLVLACVQWWFFERMSCKCQLSDTLISSKGLLQMKLFDVLLVNIWIDAQWLDLKAEGLWPVSMFLGSDYWMNDSEEVIDSNEVIGYEACGGEEVFEIEGAGGVLLNFSDEIFAGCSLRSISD
jgi:hypothetical protein